MSATVRRLDRLYPALSAKERAVLVLKAWKEDRETDPAVRYSMPQAQAAEFNRLIGLMNAANFHLGRYVLVIELLLGQLDLRYAWLATLRLWGMQASSTADYIGLYTKDPVTESEHRRLLEKERARMAPLSELAELLAERCYDEEQGDDAAWDKVLREKKAEIQALVQSGVLVGKQRGKRLLVGVGSFYDWLGEPVPLHHLWGRAHEVFPDDEAEEVYRLRKARRDIAERLARAPYLDAFSLPDRRSKGKAKQGRTMAEVAEVLETRLRGDLAQRWKELRATEVVLEEAREEFGGEDAAHPELRQSLGECKLKVQESLEGMERFGLPVELEEPDQEPVEQVRGLLERRKG